MHPARLLLGTSASFEALATRSTQTNPPHTEMACQKSLIIRHASGHSVCPRKIAEIAALLSQNTTAPRCGGNVGLAEKTIAINTRAFSSRQKMRLQFTGASAKKSAGTSTRPRLGEPCKG